MKDNKNFLKAMLSYITYKKKKEVKKFTLLETNEDSDRKQEDDQYTQSADNVFEEKMIKGVKKPIPASEYHKEKKKIGLQPDEKAISTDISINMDFILRKFNAPVNKDIVIRELKITGKYKAFIVYLDGMVDKMVINNFILRPLLRSENFLKAQELSQLHFTLENILETNQTKKIYNHDDVISEILVGNTCLYVEGSSFYISSETKGFEKRGVATPQTEGVVKGPQEAFNENLRTNITLVRRIIKNNNLTTEFLKVGEESNSMCAICMYVALSILPL